MTYWGPRQSIRSAFGDELATKLKASKRVKKVENNTYLWTDDNGTEHLRLHKTDIISRTKDGKVTINDGGFRTVTTKARLNAYLRKFGIHASISSANGVWWVHYEGAALPYWSGMCLPDDLGTPNREAHKQEIEARKESIKLARGVCRTKNELTNTIYTNAMKWAGFTETQLMFTERDNKRSVEIVKRYLNSQKGLVL